MKKPGADRNGSTPGLGIAETRRAASLCVGVSEVPLLLKKHLQGILSITQLLA